MNLDQAISGLASVLPPLGQRPGVSVLCYHEVSRTAGTGLGRFGVTAEAMEAHLRIAHELERPPDSLGDLHSTSTDSVLFTFDDNLPSHVSFAVPILQEFGASAVFFLSPADLGAPGQLSRRGVDTVLGAGMYVGAHGNHHVTADTRSGAEFATDARACAEFLTSLGMPLTWSYPGGHLGSFSELHERILRDHGFELRFTTLEGVCLPNEYHRPQSRYVIRRDSSTRYVRAAMRGGLQLMALCKRLQATL